MCVNTPQMILGSRIWILICFMSFYNSQNIQAQIPVTGIEQQVNTTTTNSQQNQPQVSSRTSIKLN